MTTVLRHAKLLSMNDSMDYFPDGYIAFSGDSILEAGSEKDFHAFENSLELDMHGDIVMPAFVNCHTHLGMAAFRSLGDDMKDRLNRFLFPLENECMTSELVYASSCICIAEMLLSGTASALDMYYFEDAVIKSASDMNFRLWAGETLLDSPHCDAQDFSGGMKLIEKQLSLSSSTVQTVCAPHAPYSVCEKNLHIVKDFARQNGILWSMHVSEMPSENQNCREKYRCSPIKYLADKGLLDSNLLAAHCIYTDSSDMVQLAGCGFSAVHCPVSNAKAAKGVAPIDAMLKNGITVTLGTDGPSSGNTLDMFTQMKSAVMLQKNLLRDRSALPAKEIVKLATCNGGKALRAKIGMLTAGYKADILVLSTAEPNMIPVHDIYSAVVYSAQVQNVKHLWVNGKLTVKNHELTSVSLPRLAEDFNKAAKKFNEEAGRRA